MSAQPPTPSSLIDRLRALKMSLFELARETVGKQEGFFTRYVPSENAKIAKANIATLEEAIAAIEKPPHPSPDRDGLVEKLAAAAFRASDISTALYIPLQKAIAIIKGESA